MKLSGLILVSVLCLPTIAWGLCTENISSQWDCTTWAELEALAEGVQVGLENGDTITLAAGTHSVSSTIAPIKQVTIRGSGTKETLLTIAGSTAFNIGGTPDSGQIPVRITNFTFNNTTATYAVYAHGAGWRVDNNTFDCRPYGAKCRSFFYDNKDRRYCPTWNLGGLVDNNTFYDGYPSVRGSADWPVGGLTASYMACHAEVVNLGGAASVYFEDNYIVNTVFGDVFDSDYGGGYVARYNVIVKSQNAGGVVFDAHPFNWIADHERGSRSWEIYRNIVTHGDWTTMDIRGGTGVIWGNDLAGAGAYAGIRLRNDRVSACDGVSAESLIVDGTDGGGRLCRDQIGAGKDIVAWSGTGNWPTQEKQPAYIWGNGGTTPIWSDTAWVMRDRDWYDDLNGHVLEGTLAARPSSCTTGFAYWATDQGTWNRKPGGQQGQLFKCGANGTWSLYYTPYEYPHPLQNYSAIPVPPGGTITTGAGGTLTLGTGGSATLP